MNAKTSRIVLGLAIAVTLLTMVRKASALSADDLVGADFSVASRVYSHLGSICEHHGFFAPDCARIFHKSVEQVHLEDGS